MTPSRTPSRLSLVALAGRPVTAPARGRVGALRDLIVDLTSPSASVTAAVLGDFQGRWRVPWTNLVLDPPEALLLVEPGDAPSGRDVARLDEHELMLVRDVLDTRVYDVPRRRTVRVGDVWLDRHADGSLEVAGLEVGFEVLLRRLGLRRRRAEAVRLVPLSRVHLTSPRGHSAQLATPSSSVHRLDGDDLAHLLTHLSMSAAADVIRQLPHRKVSRVMEHLHPQVVSRLDHALDGDAAAPRRRWRRTAGWRLYRPPGDDGRSTKRPGSTA